MANSERDDALAFLRSVMDDTTTGMANRIKAAQAIVAATSAAQDAASDVHDLDDGELLARARGEGGIPPREGPEASGLSRDPSQAHGGDPKVPPSRETPGVGSAAAAGATRAGELLPARSGVPRGTLSARKGTQKGPEGTQIEPANSIPIAPSAKNGQPLEPWE